MRISTIAFANLKRRKGKALFLIAGIAIGIGTVVALLSLSSSIEEEIGSQLDRFGANIVVVPQSNSLSLNYGGITVSGVSFDVHELSAVVLAIGALMIFTTMMGSVIERTKEIGVLRAIGFRKVHVVKGLMIEVTAIGLVGGLAGWAAGMLASWAALPYFSETGVALEISSALVLLAVAAALLIGVLSSIYPAIRASRLDPSEAVRYV